MCTSQSLIITSLKSGITATLDLLVIIMYVTHYSYKESDSIMAILKEMQLQLFHSCSYITSHVAPYGLFYGNKSPIAIVAVAILQISNKMYMDTVQLATVQLLKLICLRIHLAKCCAFGSISINSTMDWTTSFLYEHSNDCYTAMWLE